MGGKNPDLVSADDMLHRLLNFNSGNPGAAYDPEDNSIIACDLDTPDKWSYIDLLALALPVPHDREMINTFEQFQQP